MGVVLQLNSWTEVPPVLTAAAPSASAYFGQGLQRSSNRVLLSEHGKNRAYIFRVSGRSLVQEAQLTGSDVAVGNQFSRAIGFDGDRAACGAPLHAGGASEAGGLYMFERRGTTAWVECAHAHSPSPIVLGHFGDNVAVGGAIVACRDWTIYLYQWGSTTPEASIPPYQAYESQGPLALIDGGEGLIFPSLKTDAGNTSWWFNYHTRSGGAWPLVQRFLIGTGMPNSFKDGGVVWNGNTVTVLPYFSTTERVYLFTRPMAGSQWQPATDLQFNSDNYSLSGVSLDGDRMAVARSTKSLYLGSYYRTEIYQRTAGVFGPAPVAIIPSAAYHEVGRVSLLGAQLLVRCPTGTYVSQGEVHVYQGSMLPGTIPNEKALEDDRKYCLTLTDGKDLELDAAGRLTRDYSLASRCRMRLLCRRGQWAYDPKMGSRLWTLKTTRDVVTQAQAVCTEALQPLIDEGAIIKVEVGAPEVDEVAGIVQFQAWIHIPGEEARVTVGTYRIGQ